MVGKKRVISIRRGDDTIKVEIRDATHRVLHRGTYRLNSKKDIYFMLSALEKFSGYTIRQIISDNDWI